LLYNKKAYVKRKQAVIWEVADTRIAVVNVSGFSMEQVYIR